MANHEERPFYVKDCTMAAIATGKCAQNLLEFRDNVANIPIGSIYYHFWGGRLHPHFEHPEFHNDFVGWAHISLHDQVLAERLGIINPTDYPNLEHIRQVVLDIVDQRLDEKEIVPWVTREDYFHFISSKIVVFDTPHLMYKPPDLMQTIQKMSHSSIFYHFIDATRRTDEGIDDFSYWLEGFGSDYQPLIDEIKNIDIYFLSLLELKNVLSKTITQYFVDKI